MLITRLCSIESIKKGHNYVTNYRKSAPAARLSLIVTAPRQLRSIEVGGGRVDLLVDHDRGNPASWHLSTILVSAED